MTTASKTSEAQIPLLPKTTLLLAEIAATSILTANTEQATDVGTPVAAERPSVTVQLPQAAATLALIAMRRPSLTDTDHVGPVVASPVVTPNVARPVKYAPPAVKAALKALRQSEWPPTGMPTRIFATQSEPKPSSSS